LGGWSWGTDRQVARDRQCAS